MTSSTHDAFDTLDGARLVRYDRAHALLLVWFGGHGVHGYDPWWREVAFWNTGDFAHDDASYDDVYASMSAHIAGEHDDE